MFTFLPPLTLYVHLPWCARKCPYCDFNSHELKSPVRDSEYVDALIADLEQDLPSVWGRACHAVFIGGGTPSLFSPAAVDRLLSAVRARLQLVPGAEVTLEANPGSSETDKFVGFREAGINRLSIGVQSFDRRHLESLGRIHDSYEALAAADAAKAAGFDNFNLDLMFGLPGQAVAEAMADARTAVSSGAAHLSFYQLTIEPNTVFHRFPPKLPDDDAIWQMQQEIKGLIATHDYRQYEVSAYARDGYRCRHNLNYWQFGDYLGIGAGAHAKITFPDHIERFAKVRNPASYLEKAGSGVRIASRRRVDGDEAVFEFMLNALRLTDPVPAAMLQQRTGRTLASIGKVVHQAQSDGLLEITRGTLGATDKGFQFLNDLLERFLPPGPVRPGA